MKSVQPVLRLLLPVVAFATSMMLPGSAHAQAMAASCQVEFQKHSEAREAAVQRINTFQKKRPTAAQACAAFGSLTSAETRLKKWMSDNQQWCQINDQLIEQIGQSIAQTGKVRSQVCTAAKREAEGGVGPARGQPAPGGGVRLPQGAL